MFIQTMFISIVFFMCVYIACVVQWKEVSSRLLRVMVKIERESWVFISVYGQGSKRSEEELEEF